MSESTEYLIKNHKKTFEIFNAINNMEQEVLTEFDKAIRDAKWIGKQCFCYEDETLNEDLCINIFHKDWCYKDENNKIKTYIWFYLEVPEENTIWSFFGLSSIQDNSCIVVELTDNFKRLENYQELIEEFDKRNKDLLENIGFVKKGGKANRSYHLDIFFNNMSILKGIQNNNWGEALKQIKEIWKVVAKIDWDFLRKPIKKDKKKNNYLSLDK